MWTSCCLQVLLFFPVLPVPVSTVLLCLQFLYTYALSPINIPEYIIAKNVALVKYTFEEYNIDK